MGWSRHTAPSVCYAHTTTPIRNGLSVILARLPLCAQAEWGNPRVVHNLTDQMHELEQAATVEALFVYDAATRLDMLPAKDLSQPLTTAGTGGRGR